MESKFKHILKETSDSIDDLEKKIDDLREDFAEESAELWVDVKRNLSAVSGKLKTAVDDLDAKTDEAELQAHLGTMEAHDRLDSIKETLEKFTQDVSSKAKTGIDTVELRAHLAKMEARDFWAENGETISQDFAESSDKVKKLTLEAASEIKDYFAGLARTLSGKHS